MAASVRPRQGEARWLRGPPADLSELWGAVPEQGTVALVCSPVGPQGELGPRALPLDLIVAAAERLGALGAEVRVVCMPSDLEDYEALDEALDLLELAGLDVVIDAEPVALACGGEVIAQAAVIDAVLEADHRALVVRAAPHHVLRFAGACHGASGALMPEAREQLALGAATSERLAAGLDELAAALDFGWTLCDLRAFGDAAGLVVGASPQQVDAAALARLAALAQAEPRLALPPQLGGYPVVDRWRCTACGACAQLCPTGAASLGAAGEGLEIEVARCIRCAICVTTCPDHALSLGAVAEGGQTVSAGPLVLTVAPNRDPREARIPIEAALALGPRAAELAPKHAAFMPAQRGPVDPAWRPPTTELVTPAIAEGAPGWEDALDRANALATTRAAAARPQRIPIVSEELPFCNDNCLHCGVAELMKVATVPPLPQIVQRLEALAPRSGGRVMFAVSELTLRADFVDILVAASRAGLHTIAVVTNGRLFADRGFTARAVRAGMTHALVSLHGPTARTHQALTRTPASFEQTIKGLRELLRRRGEVTVMTNTVITKQNARHLPQLVELAAGLGVENMNLSFVQIVGNAARYRDVVVPRLGEVQGDLRSALDVGTAMGLEMGVSGLPYCALKGYERHFGVDDLTYIDSGAPPDAFEAVSAADAERAACGAPHSLPGACRLCALVAVCPGPQPEYLAQFGAGDLDPYPGPRWTLRPPSRIVAAVFPGLTAERGPAP